MHEVCVVKLLWILSFLQVSFRRQIGSALIFCRRDSVQHSTWLDRWRPLTNVFETLDAGQTGKNTRGGPLTEFYTGTLRLEVQTLVFISGGRARGVPGVPGPSLFLDQTEAQRAEKIFPRPASPLFLRVWVTPPPPAPPPLSQGLDPALFFIYNFGQKRFPFRLPSIDKWYPFHIPS